MSKWLALGACCVKGDPHVQFRVGTLSGKEAMLRWYGW